VSTVDWIRLTITAACAIAAVCMAVQARRYTKQAEASLRHAQAANREAWGDLAEMQRRRLVNRRNTH